MRSPSGRLISQKTADESTSRSRGGFERPPVSLTLERLDGPARDPLRTTAIEVVGPQLLVGRLPGEQVAMVSSR
jgi:hypothetical protein